MYFMHFVLFLLTKLFINGKILEKKGGGYFALLSG